MPPGFPGVQPGRAIVKPSAQPPQFPTNPQPVFVIVQAAVIPPPPVAVQVIPGANPAVVETVPQSFPVASQATSQPLQAAQVIPGSDPSRVETVPVPIRVQATNIPQPLPAASVTVGFVVTVAAVVQPWAQTVQTIAAVAEPLTSAQVLPGYNPASAETVPVPKTIQSSSIPFTVQTAQVLFGANPAQAETVPRGALVQSAPVLQPLQTVQVNYAFLPPVVAVVAPYVAYIQGAAAGQTVPLAQLWAVFTATLIPPHPGCVHISASGPSVTPSSARQGAVVFSGEASAAVGTVQGSQAGTVMAAAATVTSVLAGVSSSTVRSSTTPGSQTGAAQPSTQAGSATTTVSRGSVAVETATSKVTVDDDKEC